MKICFAFPNKNNPRIFYIKQASNKNRVKSYREYHDLLNEDNFQVDSAPIFLTNPEDYRNYLKKNDFDYGLMIWNDIIQEFYITSKSLDYE